MTFGCEDFRGGQNMYQSNSFYIYDEAKSFQPQLFSCWQVTCGDDYQYTKTQAMIEQEPQDIICAVRTVSGEGKIITDNNIYQLTQDSLLFLPNRAIIKYLSVSKIWMYTWYNFIPNGELPFFKLGAIYHIAGSEQENSNASEMFDIMKTYNQVNSTLATIIFCNQFYRWIYTEENSKYSNLSYYNEINECLKYINANLGENINVTALAEKYGFSERHFRQLFTNITGYAPKTYQREQKLKKASALLKNTSLAVNEISDSLGYYSQFQFCRDFKTYYGTTPTAYRNGSKPAKEHHAED